MNAEAIRARIILLEREMNEMEEELRFMEQEVNDLYSELEEITEDE